MGVGCGCASGLDVRSVAGQEQSSSIVGRHGRIVYPRSAKLSREQLHKTIEALDQLMGDLVVAGFPGKASIKKPITVSLATVARRPDIDGWSYPSQHLVVLAADKWASWNTMQLRRVLMHEVAHIRIGVFFDHQPVAKWVEEGLAEWVAGGLACEGQFRLWIEVQRRDGRDERLPSLADHGDAMPIRLGYDFYASFFEFLETMMPGVVSGGSFVTSVREHGVEAALRQSMGWDYRRAEESWWGYLRKRFRNAPSDSGCRKS